MCNFDNELKLLESMGMNLKQEVVFKLKSQIYNPLCRAKCFHQHFYNDNPNHDPFFSYHNETNFIFSKNDQDNKAEYILGIEQNHGKALAGIVDNYGQILSQVKFIVLFS